MSRLAVPLAVALSLALAASASAAPKTVTKVRTGPAGEAFYTAAVAAAGQEAWGSDLGADADGRGGRSGAARTKVVLYRSQGVDGKANAVSGIVSIPKGKAPKKGWPVITYAHGTTGIADQCAPSRDVAGTPVHGYNAYISAVDQPLAEGRLCGRAHRLRGARHARHAPVPDRQLRGPRNAGHRPRRARARPAPEQDAPSSPATPRAAMPRSSPPRWRRDGRRSSSSAAPSPSRPRRTSTTRSRSRRS